MPTPSTIVPFDQMMREWFSSDPPEWVRKARAERREIERIGPRVRVELHDDNTGAPCREVGRAALVYDLFHHDCCHICGDRGVALGAIGRMFEPLTRAS